MKKILSLILSAILILGCPASAAAAGDASNPVEYGRYGSQLFIGGNPNSPIEPQANIYDMLYQKLSDSANPAPETVTLKWETTPLHYTGYYRDEGIQALKLDHPELNLGNYDITQWDTRLVSNYISELTLTLRRRSVQPANYQQNLEAAVSAVSGAGTDYEKAKAAYEWLMNNCTYNGGAGGEAESVFGSGTANGNGFVNGFKVLMDQAGVPCTLGWDYSFNRLWAYVQIDGQWYLADLDNAARLRDHYGSKYFLCGENSHSRQENAPYYMKFVGRGSGVSPAADSYVAQDDLISVTVPKTTGGQIEVLDGKAALAEGENQVAAGSNLLVRFIPESGFYLKETVPNEVFSPTLVSTQLEIQNVREPIAPQFIFTEEEKLPDITVDVKTVEHGRIQLTLLDGAGDARLSEGKNVLSPEARLHIALIPDFGYKASELNIDVYNDFEYDDTKTDLDGRPLISIVIGESYQWSAKDGEGDFELPADGVELSQYMQGNLYSMDVSAVFEAESSVSVEAKASGGSILAEQNVTGQSDQGYVPLHGDGTALKGAALRFTAAADQGYSFSTISAVVDGSPRQLTASGGAYVLQNADGAVQVFALFAKIQDGGDDSTSGGGVKPDGGGSGGGGSGGGGGGGSSSGSSSTAGNSSSGQSETASDTPKPVKVTVTEKEISDGKASLAIDPVKAAADSSKAQRVEITLPDGGKTVITIPVQNAGAGMTAVLVNADGTETVVRNSVHVKGGVAVLLEGSATVKIVDRSKNFIDVPAGSWSEDPVAFVSSRDILQGTGDTVFEPNTPMSRAMAVTALYRLAGSPKVDSRALSDVPEDAWYHDAVLWAMDNGIAAGTGIGFEPNLAVSREQTAVMLYQFGLKEWAAEQKQDLAELTFADANQIAPWASEAVKWTAGQGILTGKPGNLMDPKAGTTRAEFASMMMRFLENGVL